MSSSNQLYEKLLSFKKEEHPETLLLEYCSSTLGAVERLHFDYKEKHDSRDSDLHVNDKKT